MSSSVVYASATFSFGGKVQRTTAPLVTCTGSGTLVVLSGNYTAAINGAIKATLESQSSDNKTQKTVQEVASGIKGIYGSMPFYTTDSSKTPRIGGWILGKADIAPDFKTCKRQIGPYKIPYPVRKIESYNVSK